MHANLYIDHICIKNYNVFCISFQKILSFNNCHVVFCSKWNKSINIVADFDKVKILKLKVFRISTLLKELVQFGQYFDFEIRRDCRKKNPPMSAASMSR